MNYRRRTRRGCPETFECRQRPRQQEKRRKMARKKTPSFITYENRQIK